MQLSQSGLKYWVLAAHLHLHVVCTYCTTSNLLTANALSPDIGLRKSSFFRQPALRDT